MLQGAAEVTDTDMAEREGLNCWLGRMMSAGLCSDTRRRKGAMEVKEICRCDSSRRDFLCIKLMGNSSATLYTTLRVLSTRDELDKALGELVA